jgi:hypothetical protein
MRIGNAGPGSIDSGATREQLMAAYDNLPPALRRVLANAPRQYDPREVRKFWVSQSGLAPETAAAILSGIFEKSVSAQ